MNVQMVTTALELPGHEVVRNIGVVRGIVVRSRSIVGSLLGGLQPFLDLPKTALKNASQRCDKI